MAIKLTHIKKKTEQPEPLKTPPPFETSENHEEPVKKSVAKSTKTKFGFIKRGAEAQAIIAQEEYRAKAREESNKNKIFRFYLPDNGESIITFLDGDLEGIVLDIPYYYEHQIQMNGSWKNWFVCTQDTEPCPICQSKNSPSYVGIMSVIDHSQYTSKSDNKIHKDEVRLFVVKRHTVKQLQKLAVKHGGLRGCTFDVSRIGDTAPAVGNMFDFTKKLTEEQLVAKWGDKAKLVNYEEILAAMYMSAPSLRALGFGDTSPPIGAESANSADYDNKL
jgi:hypothetical protein